MNPILRASGFGPILGRMLARSANGETTLRQTIANMRNVAWQMARQTRGFVAPTIATKASNVNPRNFTKGIMFLWFFGIQEDESSFLKKRWADIRTFLYACFFFSLIIVSYMVVNSMAPLGFGARAARLTQAAKGAIKIPQNKPF